MTKAKHAVESAAADKTGSAADADAKVVAISKSRWQHVPGAEGEFVSDGKRALQKTEHVFWGGSSHDRMFKIELRDKKIVFRSDGLAAGWYGGYYHGPNGSRTKTRLIIGYYEKGTNVFTFKLKDKRGGVTLDGMRQNYTNVVPADYSVPTLPSEDVWNNAKARFIEYLQQCLWDLDTTNGTSPIPSTPLLAKATNHKRPFDNDNPKTYSLRDRPPKKQTMTPPGSGNKIHHCHTCDNAFETKRGLKLHLRVHKPSDSERDTQKKKKKKRKGSWRTAASSHGNEDLRPKKHKKIALTKHTVSAIARKIRAGNLAADSLNSLLKKDLQSLCQELKIACGGTIKALLMRLDVKVRLQQHILILLSDVNECLNHILYQI